MEAHTKEYQLDLISAITNLRHNDIDTIATKLFEIKQKQKTVYVIGNGGSAATPVHAAGDWSKSLEVKTLCLTDNIAAVTAFANDDSYGHIFEGQLKIFLNESDLVIGFSGSGNSENVLRGIEYAKSKGVFTIGLTGNYKGQMGGKLSQLADLAIVVNTQSMERIEDAHLIIVHMVKELFRAKYLRQTEINKYFYGGNDE
ncbi:SIS domain-containing protein [Candidatus Falkowbacteria bacterium]|nr:SIS domain-containing protein [Candidatus Falkowbacteria bacterium]